MKNRPAVSLTFVPDPDGFDVARLEQAALDAAAKVRDFLGLEAQRLEIEVFRERRDWIDNHTRINEGELASWVQGDAGRIIRVSAHCARSDTRRDPAVVIAHECAHWIIRAAVNHNIPAWLDEGLVLRLLHELPPAYHDALTQAARADALLPLEVLEKPFTLFDRRLKTLAYAQSRSLIVFMEQRYGKFMIRELLGALVRGETMETALRPHGLNNYLLEKEWRLELTTR